jgi:two-component system chemotaxis response regulator CheB
MDIRLPGIDGFMATQRIMQQFPTPIVVVSASVESQELKISMNALRAGALAVLEKPVGITQQDFEKIAQHLCTQLVIMSEIKVVRQRFARNLDLPLPKGKRAPAPPMEKNKFPALERKLTIMGIAASTGGPNALLEVLCKLPRDFPLPILLVQHITRSFHEGFVQWLNSLCPFQVVMVADKQIPEPGKIYTSLPDHHLVIDQGFLVSHPGAAVSRQRPSATVLFRALAENYHRHVLGVLLTGMGDDGAEGMKAIKDAGGYTIAEDESTAVVYGMPASAVRIGGVCESLPLPLIAPKILEIIYPQNKPGGCNNA